MNIVSIKGYVLLTFHHGAIHPLSTAFNQLFTVACWAGCFSHCFKGIAPNDDE